MKLALRAGSLRPVVPAPEQPGDFIRGRLRDRAGARVITLHLVNGQAPAECNNDEQAQFQPVFDVRAEYGAAVFIERPMPGLPEYWNGKVVPLCEVNS